jgi:hypothetical protein
MKTANLEVSNMAIDLYGTSPLYGIPPLELESYQPGVCNIGAAEVSRRRKIGHLGVALTVIILMVALTAGWPAWTRLVTGLTVGLAASGYLQAYYHFCAGFGSRGVYNFASPGQTNNVNDRAAHLADLAKARRIELMALGAGLLFGLVAFALPV